jgi:hypothetical protein
MESGGQGQQILPVVVLKKYATVIVGGGKEND